MLRGADGDERYGRRDVTLTIEEKERLRIGTLLAVRTADGITACLNTGTRFIMEQPPATEGYASMFNLDEFVYIWDVMKDILHTAVFPQCGFGSDFLKLTEFRGDIELDGLPDRCQHPQRKFRTPGTNEVFTARHPPLVGQVKAIPLEDWTEEHEQRRAVLVPRNQFLTDQAKRYPSEMNKWLARRLVHGALTVYKDRRTTGTHPENRPGAMGASEPQSQGTHPEIRPGAMGASAQETLQLEQPQIEFSAR